MGESTARRRPRRSSLERSEALDSSKSPSSSSSRYAAVFGKCGTFPDTMAFLRHAYKQQWQRHRQQKRLKAHSVCTKAQATFQACSLSERKGSSARLGLDLFQEVSYNERTLSEPGSPCMFPTKCHCTEP